MWGGRGTPSVGFLLFYWCMEFKDPGTPMMAVPQLEKGRRLAPSPTARGWGRTPDRFPGPQQPLLVCPPPLSQGPGKPPPRSRGGNSSRPGVCLVYVQCLGRWPARRRCPVNVDRMKKMNS